jgi:redox-sensing transcriptional repressor
LTNPFLFDIIIIDIKYIYKGAMGVANSPMSIMLYNRLISYLRFMKQLPEDVSDRISSTVIAGALGVNDVQVRKDLAVVSNGGRPKIGYITKELITDLEHFLGHDNYSDTVLVGAGNLGRALLSYENFAHYGLKIVAAFDHSPDLIGTSVGSTQVLDAAKITDLCRRLAIHIGIITVPALFAQDICDRLIAGGVCAIWNFAPVNLRVPDNIILKNEDMAASLAVLMRRLSENNAR